MKKGSLLIVLALLSCLVYSCSKDDNEPIYVSYLSGTFTPGGESALICTVDGDAVTSGEVKLTVVPEGEGNDILTLNNIVPGVASLTVPVEMTEGDDCYEITGSKSVDGKTVTCKGTYVTESYSEAGRSLTLTVTTK